MTKLQNSRQELEKEINKTRSWPQELTVLGEEKDIKANKLKSRMTTATRSQCDNETLVDWQNNRKVSLEKHRLG